MVCREHEPLMTATMPRLCRAGRRLSAAGRDDSAPECCRGGAAQRVEVSQERHWFRLGVWLKVLRPAIADRLVLQLHIDRPGAPRSIAQRHSGVNALDARGKVRVVPRRTIDTDLRISRDLVESTRQETIVLE